MIDLSNSVLLSLTWRLTSALAFQKPFLHWKTFSLLADGFIHLFIPQTLIIRLLIGMFFVILAELCHGRMCLMWVSLLLILNLVSGTKFELIFYVYLFQRTRLSLIFLHDWDQVRIGVCILLPTNQVKLFNLSFWFSFFSINRTDLLCLMSNSERLVIAAKEILTLPSIAMLIKKESIISKKLSETSYQLYLIKQRFLLKFFSEKLNLDGSGSAAQYLSITA